MACVEMLPGNLNLTLQQGDTFTLSINWTSDDYVVDLTGYTAEFILRQSGVAVMTLTSDDGDITLDAFGNVTITGSATDTAALTPGSGDYGLRLTSYGGVVTTLLAGMVGINGSLI